MITDVRKSIKVILYERVSSPFYGTFIVSWLVWNWEIIYLTFFIDSSEIDLNKIEYIKTHFSSLSSLVTFPLISTIVLLTLIPFISNGAYWLSLKFNKWKVDQKNKVETSSEVDSVEVERIYNSIVKGEMLKEFIDYSTRIKNGIPFKKEEENYYMGELIRGNLIKLIKRKGDSAQYELTPLGEGVLKYQRTKNLT